MISGKYKLGGFAIKGKYLKEAKLNKELIWENFEPEDFYAEYSISDTYTLRTKDLLTIYNRQDQIEPASIFFVTLNNGEVIDGDTIQFDDAGKVTFESSIQKVKVQYPILSKRIMMPESVTRVDYVKTDNFTSMREMFYNCKLLEYIDTSNWVTKRIKDMSGMFCNCYALNWISLDNFDTRRVTDMASMFANCKTFTSIDISTFDTSKVTKMNSMFAGCLSLETLTYGNTLNTGNVTDMSHMFGGCSFVTLDLSSWDVSKVTNMSYMFDDCTTLETLNISGWNTSNVANMSNMFYECVSLVSFDTSSLNTSNVTNMSSMFWNCLSLNSLDLSTWDVSNVTNMFQMFFECSKLKNLDIANWITTKLTKTREMFCGCTMLESLDLSKWNISKVTEMQYMFQECKGLRSLNLSTWSINNENYVEGMFENASSDIDWNFQCHIDNSILIRDNYKGWAVSESDVSYSGVFPWSNTGYIAYRITDLGINIINTMTAIDYYVGSNHYYPFKSVAYTKDGTFTDKINDYKDSEIDYIISFLPPEVYNIEFGKTYITELISINGIKIKNNMGTKLLGMFENCGYLRRFDAGKVNFRPTYTNIKKMFANCSSLEYVNLSNWNNVSYEINSMFNGCSNLKVLNLSTWLKPGSYTDFLKGVPSNIEFCYNGNNYSEFKYYDISELEAGFIGTFPWDSSLQNGSLRYKVYASSERISLNTLPRYSVYGTEYTASSAKIRLKDGTTLSGLSTTATNNPTFSEIDYIDCTLPAYINGLKFFHSAGHTRITEIVSASNIHVSSFENTFYACSYLTSFDTTKLGIRVTYNDRSYETINLSSMFQECDSIKVIDLSEWFINSDRFDISFAFVCRNLEKLNISTWSVPQVIDDALGGVPASVDFCYDGSNYVDFIEKEITEEDMNFMGTFPWNK